MVETVGNDETVTEFSELGLSVLQIRRSLVGVALFAGDFCQFKERPSLDHSESELPGRFQRLLEQCSCPIHMALVEFVVPEGKEGP